jgi:branched-chain amino acid transport system substrate-binding protein
MSLTGTYAKPGSYQKEGYDICVEEVNAKGGLLGRKIEFVVYDDQSMPATAVKLYEKLITEDKVDAVMGPYSSAVSEAVANVTEKYKKVMVAPLAATTSIFKKGRKYIFMVVSPAEVYLDGLADMAAKRGLKTVAIVNEDTLFPKASMAGFAETAKKRGMQVVLQEAYPKGNTDFSALLVKIKSLNPDVIAAGTYFDDAVAITRQMKELNVNPKMFGLTVGGDLPEFHDLLKQNADYVYGATQWDETLAYPGQKEFLAAYTKRFKHEPSYHAAAGYGGLPRLRGGGQAGGNARFRQGPRRAAQAEDEDGVRGLRRRPGRLSDRAQGGDAPVAGRQAHDRLAGGARQCQAAVSDAGLEPAVAGFTCLSLVEERPPEHRRGLSCRATRRAERREGSSCEAAPEGSRRGVLAVR